MNVHTLACGYSNNRRRSDVYGERDRGVQVGTQTLTKIAAELTIPVRLTKRVPFPCPNEHWLDVNVGCQPGFLSRVIPSI